MNDLARDFFGFCCSWGIAAKPGTAIPKGERNEDPITVFEA
jgi:hypothetical protein